MLISAKVIGSGISYEIYSRQEPGVGRGHKDFVLSRGELMNFAVNPKRWLDGYREDDDEDTDATRWGSFVESLAGLNGDFEERYAIAPAEYTSKAMRCPRCGSITDSKVCRACKCDREEIVLKKPWNSGAAVCEKWASEQGDREIIKSELYEKAKLAVVALQADPDVSELFRCSRKQVMVVGLWKDEATGLEIPLRCLLDLVPPADHAVWGKTLADFKTARNGCPDLWARVTDDSGYDVQAALSLDLYTAATSEDRTDWIHVVQENVHPYHVVKPMPALTAEFLAFGRAKYQIALREYAQCLVAGRWPSYSIGNRLVMGAIQLIGPESVWRYRETGGSLGSRQDYQPEPASQLAAERPDVGH